MIIWRPPSFPPKGGRPMILFLMLMGDYIPSPWGRVREGLLC